MNRLLLLALPLLASCSSGETPAERAEAARTSDDGIECALAGSGTFERQCTLERGEGGVLTVHHPDGGFRRVEFAVGPSGVIPADGSDKGQIQTMPDGRIEWTIDRDRYRLPAQTGTQPAS